MINVDNDEVEIFRDDLQGYRWRRVDGDNGKIVATGSESYTHKDYAREAAEAYNPGLEVFVVDR